jgi:DNA-nicking Smr family endonuclease
MRPKLDEIRQQLISLSLHRTPPKKKTPPKAVADKENSHNSFALAKSTTTAKAGKTAYPVLVSGEVSNIFKTSKKRHKLCLKTDLVTLDLHGMSKQQALQLLDEKLPVWVDLAMKGHHPFVLAVDIICGGGTQLLSEVVAQWIGDNNQVANRPKGYLMM